MTDTSRTLLIVLTALAVGSVHILPNVLLKIELGPLHSFTNFKPIPDEENYWARIREVYDGRTIPTHGIYWEHQNDPVVLPPVAEMTIGHLGSLLGISISSLAVTVDFLWPAMIFLFGLNFLIRGMRVSFAWSYLTSLALVLMSVDIARVPEVITWLVARITPGLLHPIRNEPFWIDRTISPQFAYPFFLAYLTLLRAQIDRPSIGLAVVAGALLGLVGLQAPFFYVYLGVGTFMFACFALLRGRRRLFWHLLIGLSTAVVILLPFVVYYMQTVIPLPAFKEMQERGHEVFTRTPLFSKRDLVIALAFPFLASRKHPAFGFVYLFILAGLVCTNLQLLFGSNMIPWHFMLYTNAFWAVLAMGWAFSTRFPLDPSVRSTALVCGGALMLFANGLFVELRLYFAPPDQAPRGGPTWSQWKELQPYGAGIEWLNTMAPLDSVVVGGGVTGMLVPVLTHCNYYAHPLAQFSTVSTYEQMDRAMRLVGFYGVPRDRAGIVLTTGGSFGQELIGMVPRNFYHGRDLTPAKAEISQYVWEKYPVAPDRSFTSILSPYRADFAMVGVHEAIEFQDPNLRDRLRATQAGRLRYSDSFLDIYDLR